MVAVSSAASTTAVALPYVVGQNLTLECPGGQAIHLTIKAIYPPSMTPVMKVQMKTPNGYQEAILKLFDRRLGRLRKRHPYSQQTESAWQDYVRHGKVDDLLRRLRRQDDLEDQGIDEEETNESKTEWEKLGEDEGRIHYKTQKLYTTEVRAYNELQALQGRCIPRLIASGVYNMAPTPSGLPPVYFQAPGILLQYISGFNLAGLTSNLPNQPLLWEEAAQSAVDAARDINRAGVINMDCHLKNVVVTKLDEHTFQSFLVDFAQAAFKSQYKDTEDESDEDGFPYHLRLFNNPAAIGLNITSVVHKAAGYKLRIKY